MAEILMPQMGESIAEGTLTRWFKKPGESVKRDEPLFEISTDKVDAEIPSPADGVLEKIIVEEGSTVEVNTIVAVLGDGAGGGGNGAAAPAAEAPPAPEPAAAPAPAAAAPAPATPAPAPAPSAAPASAEDAKKARSSPLVRRIAREHGITDISVSPGTGVGGRGTKTDILAYIDGNKGGAAPAAAPARTAPAAAPASGGHGGGGEWNPLPVLNLPRENTRTEPMSIMRKKIAEHMVHSRRVSAHVHSVFEIDMDHIAKLRNRKKGAFKERHGVNLTFMPFFMKACVDALMQYPWVNASVDGEEVVMHNAVNLGIAVALESGLIVPVVKNAQELNLVGLQSRVTDLGTRARSKKLLPDEVQGGTFTITNPGAFGNEFGIPIINQPQVAILGIGGVKKRAVVVEGDAIAVRSTCFMCLSYDHRIVDGALADQFMAKVKENLENWDDSTLE